MALVPLVPHKDSRPHVHSLADRQTDGVVRSQRPPNPVGLAGATATTSRTYPAERLSTCRTVDRPKTMEMIQHPPFAPAVFDVVYDGANYFPVPSCPNVW